MGGAVLETRLFPKGQGARAYDVTGVAARCDLVVLSDRAAPHEAMVRRGPGPVRRVFVSLRNPQAGLSCFLREVLPNLAGPVTVISGSVDQTFPTQLDARFPPYPRELHRSVMAALDDPRITRWYAENLSGRVHPKLEPLPLGLVFETPEIRAGFAPRPGPPLRARPLTAFCAHRVREGGQWAARREVSRLASTDWEAVCEQPGGDLPLSEFDAGLSRHAFVLCVQGGGLDPSPKAWRSLILGAVPIIEESPVADAYRRLPVVIVADWRTADLTPERLSRWRTRLAPWFEGEGRAEVLRRLSLDYWWSRVCEEERAEGPAGGQLAIGPADPAA